MFSRGTLLFAPLRRNFKEKASDHFKLVSWMLPFNKRTPPKIMLSSRGSSDSFFAMFLFLLYLYNLCGEIIGEIDAVIEFSWLRVISFHPRTHLSYMHIQHSLYICALSCNALSLLFLLARAPVDFLCDKSSLHF